MRLTSKNMTIDAAITMCHNLSGRKKVLGISHISILFFRWDKKILINLTINTMRLRRLMLSNFIFSRMYENIRFLNKCPFTYRWCNINKWFLVRLLEELFTIFTIYRNVTFFTDDDGNSKVKFDYLYWG